MPSVTQLSKMTIIVSLSNHGFMTALNAHDRGALSCFRQPSAVATNLHVIMIRNQSKTAYPGYGRLAYKVNSMVRREVVHIPSRWLSASLSNDRDVDIQSLLA